MKILPIGTPGVHEVVDTLQNGGLVISPSDTVYGVLVDATNEEAVKKLIAFKNRPPGKSISVFVGDFAKLVEYVDVSKEQQPILDRLLPGPFTIVLPSKHTVSRLLESEKGTLGVRIPKYDFINNLINTFGKPTTATSANLSGHAPHYSVESLLNQLPQSKKDLIDLVIDGGKLPHNKPSTVMDLTTPTLKILRHGDVEWSGEMKFVTHTPTETRKTAQFILDKINTTLFPQNNKPVVMILKGDLGVGKTMFVKGLAEMYGINSIISPTFTIYYEYVIKNGEFKNLYHFDLYNIDDPEEFKHLGIEKILEEKNLICVEWGEKSGEIFEQFKQKANVVFITIKYLDQHKRELSIQY